MNKAVVFGRVTRLAGSANSQAQGWRDRDQVRTRIGRRDRNLLLVALQTGLRVSELIGLNVGDVVLGPSSRPHLRCRGKGRKERATPLRGDSAKSLARWLPERAGSPQQPLFASKRKRRFSRDGIERIVRKYARLASATCPSLAHKRVSPHTLRHTAAMELLATCTLQIEYTSIASNPFATANDLHTRWRSCSIFGGGS